MKRRVAPLFSRLQGNESWGRVEIRDDDDELRVAEKLLPLLSHLSLLLTTTLQEKNTTRPDMKRGTPQSVTGGLLRTPGL